MTVAQREAAAWVNRLGLASTNGRNGLMDWNKVRDSPNWYEKR